MDRKEERESEEIRNARQAADAKSVPLIRLALIAIYHGYAIPKDIGEALVAIERTNFGLDQRRAVLEKRPAPVEPGVVKPTPPPAVLKS